MPVVAAGGVGDSAGFVAMLRLGYAGVQMGTRFIATPECRASRGLQAGDRRRERERTSCSPNALTGMPVAVLNTPYVQRAWAQRRVGSSAGCSAAAGASTGCARGTRCVRAFGSSALARQRRAAGLLAGWQERGDDPHDRTGRETSCERARRPWARLAAAEVRRQPAYSKPRQARTHLTSTTRFVAARDPHRESTDNGDVRSRTSSEGRRPRRRDSPAARGPTSRAEDEVLRGSRRSSDIPRNTASSSTVFGVRRTRVPSSAAGREATRSPAP